MAPAGHVSVCSRHRDPALPTQWTSDLCLHGSLTTSCRRAACNVDLSTCLRVYFCGANHIRLQIVVRNFLWRFDVLDTVARCKIHPAIGIARVGNSPSEFYVGPENPGVSITPPGGFKDSGEIAAGVAPRVRRQAARFRIFAYDADGKVLGEITDRQAAITWAVHLVNSKAEADRFAGKAGEELPIGQRRPRNEWRNKDIEDRASLIIDPGSRTVSGPNQVAHFAGGTFRGLSVPLGDLRTDEAGRLLILGGFGKSASSNPGQRIGSYANNDLWHDDISDGPVTATVTLKSGTKFQADGAWVIVAPPDFAPSTSNVVTLYDVALDTALRNDLVDVVRPSSRPSFIRDIAPIFTRLANLTWLQQGGRGAGGGSPDFARLDDLAHADSAQRKVVFDRFRNPHLAPTSNEAKAQATADFLPALSGDSGDAEIGNPECWLHLTKTQYDTLAKWRDGAFDEDWTGSPATPSRAITPQGLDRAALEACAGGAFYPGIEGGWLLRNPSAYKSAFRLDHERLKAGDVTRRMACPWQADFFECRWHWWPAQRPDEVLTTEAYRRLRHIDDVLERPDMTSREARRLRTERNALWNERSSWTRGLPLESYAGDLAMIERWAQHGFVVSTDKDGELLTFSGQPASVETERGRYEGLSWGEYFHILTNIEQHPDFLPKAREIANGFFAAANYDADENYVPFEYTPQALDRRMKKIYDEYVVQMNEPSRMDTGRIQYPVVVRREDDREVSKLITFEVGRFSDRVVKERLRQRAPFNLVDGAWLQRIQSAGPVDEIRSNLFAVWDDEAGNGRADQNHCNVYDTLLRSLNIYMPPITARKFIEQDLLPGAFIQPVFQLAVSLFPDEFFPELLGMTLYLEWEASPTLTPTVRHYRGRGINPHFYALHVAIDNITAGHGYLAKEAVKLYLQKVEDEGGSEGVQEAWRRIWRGYVTWATAGDLGTELLDLCMIIDHKQIDLSYPLMLLGAHILKPNDLVGKLRVAARGGGADALSQYLVARFHPKHQEAVRQSAVRDPDASLVAVVVNELNRLLHASESFHTHERFAHVTLSDDVQKLIARNASGEDLVRLNRLLLRDGYPETIADVPKTEPQWFPDFRAEYKRRFVELIKRKAYAAKPLHRAVKVGDQILAELFETPDRLVELLATSDLINLAQPRSSRFFEALNFSGPMYKIFTEDEKSIILDWIESLREPSGPVEPKPGPTPQEWAVQFLQFIQTHAGAAASTLRHGQYAVDGRTLKDWFSDPAGLMAAFARSPEWVVPGNRAASRLFIEFSSGKMSFMGSTAASVVGAWIDTGAVSVDPSQPADEAAFIASAPMRQHSAPAMPRPAESEVEMTSALTLPVDVRRDFAAKRKLIGMGSVH